MASFWPKFPTCEIVAEMRGVFSFGGGMPLPDENSRYVPGPLAMVGDSGPSGALWLVGLLAIVVSSGPSGTLWP